MWPLITGPSVRCLRTAFRARFVLLARPLSISRFDVRDPQTREYLKTLKTLLAMNDMSPFGKISGANIQRLRATGELYETIEKISEEMMSLEQLRKEMLETKEQDMVDIATKDIAKCHEKITQISAEIYTNLVPIELVDTQEVLLELNAGVGGQEAMLFNQDLMTMYLKFSQLTMGWNVEVTEASLSETGGLRRGVLSITGYDVGRVLKLESGVHRVQRVPKTEKSGRIHTSTATVAVLACPPEVEVNIEPRDLIVKTKRAGGPGGQHVNKTESAVQILHVPTGIMVESDTERCQQQNKSVAMKKLRAKIYDLKVSSEMNKVQSQKKLQVGNATRSEKIRTYNFTQDRITDHRLPYTVRNVEEFLQGGAPLKQIIGVLQEAYQNEQISYLIRNKLYS